MTITEARVWEREGFDSPEQAEACWRFQACAPRGRTPEDYGMTWDGKQYVALTASHGENMNKLWLVGRYKGGKWPDALWEFQGIFSTRELADNACRDAAYFYIPVRLDAELLHQSVRIATTYPRGSGPTVG